MPRRPRVSIIGASQCGPDVLTLARDIGRGLAAVGCEVVCGGLGGVMRAVCEGAREAGGRTIGILPGTDLDDANPFVDLAVATGLGPMRNFLIVLNGDMAVAVDGASGTLSEIGLALKIGRPVVAVGHWQDIDGVIPAANATEAVNHARRILGL